MLCTSTVHLHFSAILGKFRVMELVEQRRERRGGLVVGRRTCDRRVAGSRAGRDAAAQQPWAICSHPTASVTKQYNLVPAKAGK